MPSPDILSDDPTCEYCHTRDQYFHATLNVLLPYCDRDCARRASELYTMDPAVLCVTCRQNPRHVDYESNIVHLFCCEECEQTMEYMESTREDPAWNDPNVPPHHTPSQRTSGYLSGPETINHLRETIYFYRKDQPYYFLTNFAPYPVEWEGRIYPTGEHIFQAFKFIHRYPQVAEEIRTCATPREALTRARQYEDYVRADWLSEGVNILTMKFVLKLKFRQHPSIWRELLATSGMTLVEDAGSKDDFWGNGADGRGKNWLGVLLMRLRDGARRQ